MKKMNCLVLLLVAVLMLPAVPVQAKNKKEKAEQEMSTGAQDREQWVKWLWKISYPVIHNLAEGPCARTCRLNHRAAILPGMMK